MCELCDIIPDKYKKHRRIAKKYFFLHEEVIDVFHEKKTTFYLAHVRILGSMEHGKTRNDCFRANVPKYNIKFKNMMQKNSAKRPV